jgi:hypothetical protein
LHFFGTKTFFIFKPNSFSNFQSVYFQASRDRVEKLTLYNFFSHDGAFSFVFTPLPLIQRVHRGQLVDEDRDLDDGRAQRRDDLAERQNQVMNPANYTRVS